jgi:hypothetical protein
MRLRPSRVPTGLVKRPARLQSTIPHSPGTREKARVVHVVKSIRRFTRVSQKAPRRYHWYILHSSIDTFYRLDILEVTITSIKKESIKKVFKHYVEFGNSRHYG